MTIFVLQEKESLYLRLKDILEGAFNIIVIYVCAYEYVCVVTQVIGYSIEL